MGIEEVLAIGKPLNEMVPRLGCQGCDIRAVESDPIQVPVVRITGRLAPRREIDLPRRRIDVNDVRNRVVTGVDLILEPSVHFVAVQVAPAVPLREPYDVRSGNLRRAVALASIARLDELRSG